MFDWIIKAKQSCKEENILEFCLHSTEEKERNSNLYYRLVSRNPLTFQDTFYNSEGGTRGYRKKPTMLDIKDFKNFLLYFYILS